MNNQNSRSPPPRRCYFRVLRTDENIQEIVPKAKETDVNKYAHLKMEHLVLEHIRGGSKFGFNSSLISLTGMNGIIPSFLILFYDVNIECLMNNDSLKKPYIYPNISAELNVALAFGGIISRIAITHLEDKEERHVKHLDKEYLRRFLTDTDAIARSRRSDEVVVFGNITKARELQINIKKCQRFLCPGFEKDDKSFFPMPEVFQNQDNFSTEKPLSGPNKRLFRINIKNNSWSALLPRPNYSLEDPVYFDKQLVDLAKHHFACYNTYRHLTEHIARGALYVLDLSVEDESLGLSNNTYEYQWAFILLEEFTLEKIDSNKALSIAKELFTVDLLLGNWECIGGKDKEGLASQDEAIYGMTPNGKIVRIAVDRALGCIYPEDERKNSKTTIKFETKNVDQLQATLQLHYKWCFGNITDRDIVQGILQLKLDDESQLTKLKEVLKNVEWPPWCLQNTDSVWNVVQSRIDDLKEHLPYHKITPKSLIKPPGRDGHGAVSFMDKKLFIAGGNSFKGPLNDLWMFDDEKKIWEQLDDMPGQPRYSFSMHLWTYDLKNHMIAIYGGCNPHPNRKTGMLNDLMVYHIERKKWIQIIVKNQEGHVVPKGFIPNPGTMTLPEGRCRQGSNIVNKESGTAEMFVFGGMNQKNEKLKDVWKAKFSFSHDDTSSPMVQWQYLRNMEHGVHRCFSFSLEDSIFLVGGFGKSLRKLEEFKDISDSNQGYNIVFTHDLMSLPESERKSFTESRKYFKNVACILSIAFF